ncbi:hypothetical protein [Nocardia sp. NPDC049707]|uniref:hypothetical protein n=1 Tax=Nocardia sp. NPDC049707 TaxID=3154735 RepID=UPI0034273523
MANARQKVSLRAYIGHMVTVWADPRSLYISLDGHLIRTVSSRLLPEHLQLLRMRGARPAGPQSAKPALRKANGTIAIPVGEAIEIDRVVDRDGGVGVGGHHHVVGFGWVGRTVTLRPGRQRWSRCRSARGRSGSELDSAWTGSHCRRG